MTAHHAGDRSPTAMRERAMPDAGIPPRARRRRVSAAVVVIALAMMTTIATTGGMSRATMDASPAASPVASPAASPVTAGGPFEANIIVGEITIELTDTGFEPSHFESAVGRDVTITLENTGSRPHNFTMDELDIDIDLDPGETATVEIAMPKLGEYTYRSDLPGDEDFSGTMVIFI
jgi:uncharacterized cupredoxin-like copper-binding protein